MNKVLSNLGLAMRAGQLTTGEEGVLSAVRSGSAKLVIVAEDASHNTFKRMSDKCKHYNIPIVQCFTREQLGESVGQSHRVIIAVCDQGFAKLIMKALEKQMEV